MSLFNRFLNCENGAAAVEYTLLTAIVGTATIAGATKMGVNIEKLFFDIAAKIPVIK